MALLAYDDVQAEWKLVGGEGRNLFFVDENGKTDSLPIAEIDAPALTKAIATHLSESEIRQIAAGYIIAKQGALVLLVNRPETIDRVKVDQIPERGMVLGYLKDGTYAAFATDKTKHLAEGDWLNGPFVRKSSYRYTTVINSEKQVPLFAMVDGRAIVEVTSETISSVTAVTDDFQLPQFTTEYGRKRSQEVAAKVDRERAQAVANAQSEANKEREEATRRKDAAIAAQLKVLNMEADIATRSMKSIDSQLASKSLPDVNRRQLEDQKAGLLRKIDQISRQMAGVK